MADGDGRFLLNLVEEIDRLPRNRELGPQELAELVQRRAPLYDKQQEGHYNLISALHKSLRGSDTDAALYWLARMLAGGEDPIYILRRLTRAAAEGIGLAEPQAISQALAAWDAYDRLGSPEGELAIAQLVIYLATAPKSNAAYVAFGEAQQMARETGSLMPPKHILNAPTRLMRDLGYGKGARAGDPIMPGPAIRVPPLPETPAPPVAVKPQARPQDVAVLRDAVLYRDDWAIVVNKPAGLAVQGGTNTDRHVDALLDGLRFDSTERPRLVHRLDKDTSGVLLIARHAAAAAFFTRAFRDRATRKIYWAIVVGVPQLHRGRIDLALAKSGGAGRERVQAEEDGKHAVTYYTVVDHAGTRASWLALLPVTGRTHLLRAHCPALDTPLLGSGRHRVT